MGTDDLLRLLLRCHEGASAKRPSRATLQLGARTASRGLDELELPEKATVEMLIARREGTTALSSADRMQIDAIDRSITREFAGAVDKYREMLKTAGSDRADIYVDLGRTLEKSEQKAEAI